MYFLLSALAKQRKLHSPVIVQKLHKATRLSPFKSEKPMEKLTSLVDVGGSAAGAASCPRLCRGKGGKLGRRMSFCPSLERGRSIKRSEGFIYLCHLLFNVHLHNLLFINKFKCSDQPQLAIFSWFSHQKQKKSNFLRSRSSKNHK